MKKDKIDACDVFDWDYLVQLAGQYESDMRPSTLNNQFAKLAYDLTQTGDENERNKQFSRVIHLFTDNCTKETAEDFVKCMVKYYRCDEDRLRQYMKLEGVRLKRKLW